VDKVILAVLTLTDQEDQANLLEGPISLFEIDTAISSLQSGKSPGADGFPVEFFKTLKDKINKLLLRVFNTSIEDSKLPESMCLANITLILKEKKNPELSIGVLNLILLDHFAGPLMVSAIWE
uniref:Reverse transcriptase domain-containing protein n=1 Tax=Labrus bergylta TaxID=56723 RepID=A0A3Q3MDC5_9LABR